MYPLLIIWLLLVLLLFGLGGYIGYAAGWFNGPGGVAFGVGGVLCCLGWCWWRLCSYRG